MGTKPVENFRVIGKLEGKYRIQWESGATTLADAQTLATLREQHKEFSTNELFPTQAADEARRNPNPNAAIDKLAQTVEAFVKSVSSNQGSLAADPVLDQIQQTLESILNTLPQIENRLKALETKGAK